MGAQHYKVAAERIRPRRFAAQIMTNLTTKRHYEKFIQLHQRNLAASVYSDGGGLYLRIRPTGSRSWLFIYMLDGKRGEMGLGSDLDVSLARAREKAAAARALVLEGKDPKA